MVEEFRLRLVAEGYQVGCMKTHTYKNESCMKQNSTNAYGQMLQL
jgi:hypothetical protein